MTEYGFLRTDVHALAELLAAVEGFDYSPRSLSLIFGRAHIEVGLDCGDDVDDVYVWRGANLATLATHAISELKRRSQTRAPTREHQAEASEILSLLNRMLPILDTFPLDLAYVPESDIEPDRPWELGLPQQHELVLTPGVTAVEVLTQGLEALTGPAR